MGDDISEHDESDGPDSEEDVLDEVLENGGLDGSDILEREEIQLEEGNEQDLSAGGGEQMDPQETTGLMTITTEWFYCSSLIVQNLN